MNISIAFRAFFAALFDRATADRVRRALSPDALPALDQPQTTPTEISGEKTTESQRPRTLPSKTSEPPRQSEAITLLAALQREARFVDFVQESLAEFSDAQIGAAARSVHDDCAKVLQRFFELQPVVEQTEGSPIEITFDDLPLFQLTGNVPQTPPYHGKLVHAGWKAAKAELPVWSGQPETALIIAPSEVEL